MTIETKYNIGDEVWFIDNNMATQSKIRSIVIVVGGVGSIIKQHISLILMMCYFIILTTN